MKWKDFQGFEAAFKSLLVLAILLAHYGLRDYATRSVPLNARAFYPEEYSVALSLAFGKGFNALNLAIDPAHGLALPEPRQARPIVNFLRLQKPVLSREEVEEYFHSIYARAVPSPMSATRILDLRVAALIWKVFGVRWSVLFQFYSILSTLVCLLIFLTARRLSGSYWAGCLAALCFAGSVQEIRFGTISLRDVSPFWFASIAFFWLVCLTDRSRSRWWNFASVAGLGAVSLLGFGWRTDAYLLPPFLLAVMLVWLVQKRRGLRYTAVSALLYLGGCWFMRDAILLLGSDQSHLSAETFFDVASYGTARRSNLFHLENSFQIPSNDYETYALSNFYWSLRHPERPLPTFLSDPYASAMRELYLAYLKYNAFDWYQKFPAFYFRTLRSVAFPNELGSAAPRLIIAPLSVTVALFFILGSVPVFLVCKERILAAGFYLFSIYYSVVLLLVLPAEKHLTMLVLPFSILGGITAWVLAQTIRTRRLFENLPALSQRSIRIALFSGLVVLCAWAGGLATLYYYSRAERTKYLHDILTMASNSRNASPTISDRKEFSAVLGADMPPRGYLLKIRAGAHPGNLSAKHIREGRAAELALDVPFVTRHSLHRAREQFYFITMVPGKVVGDRGNYRCILALERDAEFIAGTEIDLQTWKRPAFSTVFYEGEMTAGSPDIERGGVPTEF